jgi:flavin reductase (DIM6/NTAB) family NADH-FMN oxidoreductase RutF
MTDDAFATIMSSLDAQLIVVTTAEAQERAGCLVGFHAQASIEPARYCIWLSKANHTYRVALRSTHLAIHFLLGRPLASRPIRNPDRR